jgi:mannose-6-phosphate isomerase-like protein (cupin superfamily)
MKRATLGAVAVMALAAADSRPGSATYIPEADVLATLKKALENSVTDQQIRVVDTGKINVAVGVVYRSAKAKQSAVYHDQVTEIYHVISGSGTLVTGGTLVDPKRRSADEPVVKELNGPSVGGTSIKGGESRRIGPGDVVVIPAGVGHWFSSVDGTIKYLIVRVDADKLLPAK